MMANMVHFGWSVLCLTAVIVSGIEYTGDIRPRCPTAADGCYCATGITIDLECSAPAAHVTVKMKRGGESTGVQCEDPSGPIDVDPLPAVVDGQNATIKYLGFEDCAVQTTGGWTKALNSLGYSGAKSLTLTGSPVSSLDPEFFENLNSTEVLNIKDGVSGPWKINSDMFKSLPSLRYFVVHNTKLTLETDTFEGAHLEKIELALGSTKEIPSQIFQKVPSLKFLSLFGLGLKNLPDGMLEGLDKLHALELSSNSLKTLTTASLKGASGLQILFVRSNPLETIEADALREMAELLKLEINQCVGQGLIANGGLQGLVKLENATISRCGLSNVTSDWLLGAESLVNLILSYNKITELPQQLFRGQNRLQRLDLSYNHIKEIPSGVFKQLGALLELNLDGNAIQELTRDSLTDLRSLKTLSARHCGLILLSPEALPPGLQIVVLSNNSLTFPPELLRDVFGDRSPLHQLSRLTDLDLSRNHIDIMFADWRLSVNLRRLDLSYNVITHIQVGDLNFLSSDVEVDLRYNNITTVDIVPQLLENPLPTANLNNNPYQCDCRLYSFVDYLRTSQSPLEMSHAYCASPPSLLNQTLLSVPLKELKCPIPESGGCPKYCECTFRPDGLTVELSCSKMPETLPDSSVFGGAVFELKLQSPVDSVKLSESIRLLDMQGLSMSKAPVMIDAPNGLVLDLRNNTLEEIPTSLLTFAEEHSMQMMLAGNPLKCDCQRSEQFATLQNYNFTVSDWSSLLCVDELGASVGVRSAPSISACGRARMAVVAAALAATAALAIALILAVVYTKKRREVRVWLLARGWLPDKDRQPAIYDVFVSTAEEDETWVVKELVSALESGPRPLQLCVSNRDWMPGVWIPTEITNTVAHSRRTLIVLTPSFIKSTWGQLEWRAAHARAMRERQTRVLVVLAEDVNPEDLDPDLRAYLTTNTYLRRDDPRFWQKLRDALPRTSCGAPAKAFSLLTPPHIVDSNKNRF